ncbi:GNAT family N-acetyltransferase [Methanofollis ethanolicus]|uniref:GNAT family N-acetyltransferase n=1 Tax=Methanofollis ethanolicus TaxID=488124 RepID=UPI0009F86993|nr:GNAT family N-acetyltransferase [Methanofollis ethanolicus]
MFERVLFATDFSDDARATAARIPEIPTARDVILVHVREAGRTPRLPLLSGPVSTVGEAETALARERATLLGWGLDATDHLVEAAEGDITGAILDLAGKERPSLIVVGARGRNIISGLFLGSVSAGILRRARTHVLVVHAQKIGGGKLFSRVLCPVDFSKPSLQVVSLLHRLKVPEAVLLHVVTSAESEAEMDARIRDAGDRLAELKDRLESDGIGVQTLLRVGPAADEICDVAAGAGVSLVLLPRLGRTDYITNIPIGSTAADVAKRARVPVCVIVPALDLDIAVRELATHEFPLVDEIWTHYRGQTADPATDRIFGLFIEGTLASVARCRRHPDGFEVDGVFTPPEFRGRGYAKRVVAALVSSCGGEALYMHSTLDLVGFYGAFGFVKIPESGLPTTIRDRYAFAMGEMAGSNVQPMMRPAGGESP